MYETLHVEPASSRQITNIGFIPVNPFEVKDTIYRHDHLPHIQTGGATYFITFRTDNFRILSEEARKIVMDSIKFWDEKKLKLISSVVMPDHVHLIARPLIKTGENYWDISDILHSVKSFSANAINKTEGKKGVKVWQTESYDRVVRDEKELANELAYLNDNPVKAKIVKDADDYPYRYVVQELKAAGWKPALRRKINYTVWSDVFICPECTGEVIFWEAAVDKEKGKVNDIFPCPHCHSELTKRKMDRAWTNKYDFALKESIKQAKQVPVLINYSIGKSRFEKTPDAFDLELIDKIENTEIPFWFPHDRMMEGKETRRNDKFGITHIHHFYTQRNLYIISNYLHKINSIKDSNIRKIIHLTFNSVHQRHCKMNSFRFNVSFPSNIRSGTLYISSMTKENNFFDQISNKSFRRFLPVLKIINFFKHQCVQTGSASLLKSTPNSVDYLFVDPPFGSNLNYSELSFLWEEWLKVITNNEEEAIENTVQSKGSSEYRQLMISCFKEAYRVLKPGRWMTVEFSNTKANVWNSIQTALTEAGFIVANVSALDKGGTSIMALTTSTAVKQDLVISAYKPNGGFEERFEKEIETEEGIWDFIRTHLKYLPVVKKVGFDLVSIPERDPRILYDQLIAYYVRKGYPVPINSADFQLGLAQRFIPRGGMYFLPEQAAEYDRKKILSGAETVEQFFAGFVDDEASAINWLRFLLKEKPQTFQDINPQFMKVIAGWKRTETPLELSQLLEDNFYCYDGKGPVPNQIHGYLSTNWKEMRNLEKDDPILKEKAKNRWCIPDPKDIAQIEQMRERRLLKEFEAYKGRKGKFKRSETFRLEAVRAGFKKAWQDRDYQTIINVAEKIPNNILEEDPKLLMWYDQAQTRLGD